MTRSRWIIACAALMLLSVMRVASTHHIFSATADEPVHVAAGYDWLMRGVYVLDVEHPPLARAFFGLGLRAAGVVSPPPVDWKSLQPVWVASAFGTDLLWHNGEYLRNLVSARRGNLLFFVAAMIAVALWTRPAFGNSVALIAVALFGSLPPVLAHAGLATTDMAVTAALTVALIALERWLEQPTMLRASILGIAVGAGLSAKLSFVLFFAVAGAVMIVLKRRDYPRVGGALIAAALALIVVWGLYRFDYGTLAEVTPVMNNLSGPRLANIPIPAPAFLVGMAYVRVHQQRGHPGFLLGERRDTGWWYYFPIALFFKTPLPFLILFAFGAARLIRSREQLHHVLIPLALLIAVMPASLNMGVRHILVVYPSMAIVAAFGAKELWQRTRIVIVILIAWYAIGTSLAHPDYLAWFNEAAAGHPERILVDSNLDWGQDVLRLAKVARDEKIDKLAVLIFGNADIDRIGLPPHYPLAPNIPTQGWIAVSETALQHANRGDYAWLERHRPVRRVGKSIRLYYVP